MDINLLHLQLCGTICVLYFVKLCLLKAKEHEIEEKRMCFEKCFFGIQKKKIVSNNFYEK